MYHWIPPDRRKINRSIKLLPRPSLTSEGLNPKFRKSRRLWSYPSPTPNCTRTSASSHPRVSSCMENQVRVLTCVNFNLTALFVQVLGKLYSPKLLPIPLQQLSFVWWGPSSSKSMASSLLLLCSTHRIFGRYLGDGPKLVRELFRVAEVSAHHLLGDVPCCDYHVCQENAPSIVFIDEIDAVGTKRSNSTHSLACSTALTSL